MAKIAEVRLGWVRSASADVTARKILITKNGEVSTIEVGPEVESYSLEVPALGAVSFNTIVIDDEGNEVSSETYSFVLSDLESPQPDTGLFHQIVAIRDVADPV